jgi:hypothetical protein
MLPDPADFIKVILMISKEKENEQLQVKIIIVAN